MDLDPIARQLAAFAHRAYPDDPSALLACSELLGLLPDDVRTALEASQEIDMGQLLAALGMLIQTNTEAARLAQLLAAPSPKRQITHGAIVQIQGDGNQVTIGRSSSPGGAGVVQIAAGPRVTAPSSLRLHLLSRGSGHIEIRTQREPDGGELRADVALPLSDRELTAALRAIEWLHNTAAALDMEERAILARRGLVGYDQRDRRLPAQIGQLLHRTLLVPPIDQAVATAISTARAHQTVAHIEICFDHDSVGLARYPWELLHDGQRFLLQTDLRLTRYIAYPGPPPLLRLRGPLHILHLAPRPTDLNDLPADGDRAAIEAALSGHASVASLSHPTYTRLLEAIEASPPHVLHFYGHGRLARRCPICGQQRFVDETCCDDEQPAAPPAQPQGYLAFEADDGRTHWVAGHTLGTILSRRSVQLAVLLACSSGAVDGRTVFNGAGPALIQAGVPAVVAAQSSLSVPGARAFSAGLYGALGRGKPLLEAIDAARLRLQESEEWHVPVLYLRTRR